VPRDWYAGDTIASAYLVALSLTFPAGERFFIDSVRAYVADIDDPELAASVKAFFGQEAMHGKVHAELNDMARANGLDPLGHTEAWFTELLERTRVRLSPAARLAYTAGIEHWTASLGEKLLRDQTARERIHPGMRPFLLWHALEEIEHKAVAFDVYQAVSGNYRLRAAMMLFGSAMFAIVTMIVHRRIVADVIPKAGTLAWLRAAKLLVGRGGLFEGFGRRWLAYFRPSFHPDDRDTRALLATWLVQLFGRGAPLEGTRERWPTAAVRSGGRGTSRDRAGSRARGAAGS
jgi:uncharacterized protein